MAKAPLWPPPGLGISKLLNTIAIMTIWRLKGALSTFLGPTRKPCKLTTLTAAIIWPIRIKTFAFAGKGAIVGFAGPRPHQPIFNCQAKTRKCRASSRYIKFNTVIQ